MLRAASSTASPHLDLGYSLGYSLGPLGKGFNVRPKRRFDGIRLLGRDALTGPRARDDDQLFEGYQPSECRRLNQRWSRAKRTPPALGLARRPVVALRVGGLDRPGFIGDGALPVLRLASPARARIFRLDTMRIDVGCRLWPGS